jgi:hypothetical protein
MNAAADMIVEGHNSFCMCSAGRLTGVGATPAPVSSHWGYVGPG